MRARDPFMARTPTVTALARARAALRTGGEPLPAEARAIASRLGRDFSHVRVHGDATSTDAAQRLGARAFTFGSDIVLAHRGLLGDRRLMAHELVHVAQAGALRAETPEGVSHPDSPPEREAHGAAEILLRGGRPRVTPAPAGLLMRQPAPAAPPTPQSKFESAVEAPVLGVKEAHHAIEQYRQILANLRLSVFQRQHAKGNIGRLLRALSATDVQTYRAEVQQLLRWIQESETHAASGMTDAQMAGKQAAFAQAEALKQAQAALKAATPKGKTPPKPTAADLAAAHKKQVQATSIQPSTATGWAAMSGPQKKKWQARGSAAVNRIVAHGKKVAPELKLASADFLADFPGVESRGAGVLAYGQPGGPHGTVAVFGYAFVKSVEADPAYVMDIVVHEIFGHPEYGVYGTEYHLALYDQSMATVPGYTKPVGPGRTSELDAYAYQETEIYALLRGFAYHKPLAKADQGKGLITVDAPNWVAARIGLMKSQWEPALATALVRGLYQRLRVDPRITPPALKLFTDGVKTQFDAASAAAILK